MSDLQVAIRSNDSEQVLRLMQAGPPSEDVRDAAITCIERGRTEMLSILLSNGGDPNLRLPGQEWTLLHLALEHQNASAVALLLEHGADVGSVDASGCTPLHHAVDVEADAAYQADKAPEPVLIRLLLKAGADPSARDAEGKTPTDIAREYGYTAALAEFEAQQSH